MKLTQCTESRVRKERTARCTKKQGKLKRINRIFRHQSNHEHRPNKMPVYDLQVKLAFPHHYPPSVTDGPSGDHGEVEVVKYVNLELETYDSVVHWNGLTQKDFEVAHGLTRIIKIVPDQLATALTVNRERLPDTIDDGHLSLALLDKLLASFEALNEKNTREKEENTLDMNHNIRTIRLARTRDPWPQSSLDGLSSELLAKQLKPTRIGRIDMTHVGGREHHSGIAESIKRLRLLLVKAKEALAVRDEVGYKLTAQRILQACRDVRYLTETYCKLAHPIMVETKMKNFYAEDIVDIKASQTDYHLQELGNLEIDYLRLLNP